jgi:hypothetical protein
MKRYLFYPALLILLILGACVKSKSKSAEGIIPEKQMVDLVVDTHLAVAILFIENSRAEDKKDKALYYYPSVLEKYGVTKAQMDSSISWYMKNPEAYTRIYEQVLKKLEDLKAAENKANTAK